jgi:hypothetical protein
MTLKEELSHTTMGTLPWTYPGRQTILSVNSQSNTIIFVLLM